MLSEAFPKTLKVYIGKVLELTLLFGYSQRAVRLLPSDISHLHGGGALARSNLGRAFTKKQHEGCPHAA